MPVCAPDADPAGAPAAGFGIYVHWPFCASKCPYCDFNSHVRASVDQARWRAALLAECGYFARLAGGGPVTSIFFGGGTPSLMAPETVQAVIERVRALWPVAERLEVTLEANPTSVEAGRFAAFRAAGVNRLSLGVQSLDDRALGFLGRGHDGAEALAALDLAKRHFDRVSFDLIYALPGQTAAEWRAELARALDLAADHLSLYQLTIEPNTGFAGAVRRGDWLALDDDRAAELYEVTQELTAEAGLPAYEISNHARAGAACRHNLTYWRYGDYVGVGPGAHGRLSVARQRRATQQWRKPEAWLAAVERDGHACQESRALDADERAAEALLMGLRLTEGIHFANFENAVGRPLDDYIDLLALNRLLDGGFLARDRTALRATPEGRRVLNAVLADLLNCD